MEIRLKRNSRLLGIFLFFALLSCDKNLIYEHFQKVDEQAWNYKDVLQFSISVQKKESVLFSVALRNTSDFQNANIWLFLSIESPSGKVQQDTLNCLLANDYGYWLGSGFSGLYLTEHSLDKLIDFDEQGDWNVRVTHGMREDSIQGISEVGLLIRKAQK